MKKSELRKIIRESINGLMGEKKQEDDGVDYLKLNYRSRPWEEDEESDRPMPSGTYRARDLRPGDYIRLNRGPYKGEYAAIIGKDDRDVYYTHHSLLRGTFANINKMDLKPGKTKRNGKATWLFTY